MKRFVVLGLVMGLGACSTVIEGDEQAMGVTTPNCPAAQCTLVNERGQFDIGATPGNVQVKRSTTPMRITCRKQAAESEITVESGTEGVALGNILFGLGGVVTAGVDMASGAAYKYPEEVVHPLSCPPAG